MCNIVSTCALPVLIIILNEISKHILMPFDQLFVDSDKLPFNIHIFPLRNIPCIVILKLNEKICEKS